jgi:hypothetical protein
VTRDEILAMKSGRRLDALVAEKILGWKITWPITDEYDWVVGVHGRMNYGVDPTTNKEDHLPFPSTDIREAFMVERHFWATELKRINGQNQWVFTISNSDDAEIWWATGDTAPEAICKAALINKLGL